MKKNWKATLKKVWWFLWEDNSPASWVANIILAFVIIKYLVYPGLGIILGTSYPIVAVVSGSMEHDRGFDQWWDEQCCSDAFCASKHTQGATYQAAGVDKQTFLTFPFPRGFNKGDIMVLYDPQHTQLGDILVFAIPNRPDPIIHRVIGAGESYTTKGDHNCQSAEFEQHILPDQTLGKAILRVPYLGWIKIIFVELVNLLR